MLDELGLPRKERAYLHELTHRLRTTLGSSLMAVYLFGSAARNGYIPGQSDLDVQAIISTALPLSTYTALAATISHFSLPCPATKLELVLYTSAEAQAVRERAPRFEINFNTGSTMPKGDYLSLDYTKDTRFWFILDVAAGRDVAVPLFGPPASSTFAVPRCTIVLEALLESLEWHEGEERGPNGLANGARAWRWAKEEVWCSKEEGMEWARSQAGSWRVLEERKDQKGAGELLDKQQVGRFLLFVKEEVEKAMEQK